MYFFSMFSSRRMQEVIPLDRQSPCLWRTTLTAGSVYICRRTYPPYPWEAYIYALPRVRIHRPPPLTRGRCCCSQPTEQHSLAPRYTPTSCSRSLRACARESGCLFPPLYCYCFLRSVLASSACLCSTDPLLTLYTFS